MATIRKFTEIKAWQVGRELARDIYALTKVMPFAKDYGLRDQIQRAVVSINSNIAEGFERDSNPEFVKFLGYAKGSAGETLSQLITAHDVGYVDDESYEMIAGKLSMVSAMLARLRTRLIAADHTGLRWKTPPAPPNPQPSTLNQKLETRNLETRNKKLLKE